jgi:hypothetical protein
MNYRRSINAQRQRLLFLAVYITISGIAAASATSKHTIGNGAVPTVTATRAVLAAS